MYENNGKLWCLEDVDKLREVYSSWKDEELEKYFKRTIKSIKSKVSKTSGVIKRKISKYTYEEVQKIFIDGGCVLLSTEYVNNGQKLKYRCECNEEKEVKLNDFIRGTRCWECGVKNKKHPKTKTQEEVIEFFLESGCKLESEYKNSKTPLKFLCKCGRRGSKTWTGFLSFPACRDCGHEYGVNKTRYSYEEVQSIFISGNCELLDETYINNKTPLMYKCECGDVDFICLSDFINGQRCKECKRLKSIKYNKEYIEELVEKVGCKYVSHERDYVQTRVTIICTCGRVDSVYLPAFQLGAKCRNCAKESFTEKMSGEFHPNWKGGISEIHVWLRGKTDRWRVSSIEDCDSKCVITGEKFDDVHHLYSFNLILQDVFIKTEIPIRSSVSEYSQEELNLLSDTCVKEHPKHPLGVCLKEDIHLLFHDIFGYGSNTPDQFDEFKKRYSNGEFNEILNERRIS